MKSSNRSRKQFTFGRLHVLLILIACGLVACAIPLFIAGASNPSSGTISPTLNATLNWVGTATGGANPNNNVPGTNHDQFCVEGSNCDTFTLTVSGTPGDWTGKAILVKIEVDLPSSDYDLFIHKTSNSGAVVGQSGNNPGETEQFTLLPTDTGTGVYTVHVVYFAATPADQYQGSATVIASDAEPVPTPTPGASLPPSCTPPGTEVATDPSGDANPLTLNPAQLDIVKVSIAEPASAAGDEKLSFSVDVAGDITTVPASAVWSVRFKPPSIAPPTTYYYASAESDINGVVTFHYGRIEGTSVATSQTGDGTVDKANKRFIINAPRTGIGNPQPGQNLTDVHGVTQQQVGVLLVQADTTRDANNQKIYTLRGNSQCNPGGGTMPSPTPFVEPTPIAGGPRFTNYMSPPGIGDSAGEPTLGANWTSGNIMYIASLEVLRVSFNDCFSPAPATWQKTNQVITDKATADPILYTDNDIGNGFQRTNRTFVSQLLSADGSSAFEFTDNDGQTYTQGAKGSGIGSGVDHQTIGSGPYAKNPDGSYKGGAPGPLTSYPNAVYYASQSIGYANLARSDDGGLNFGPAVPMYDLTICGGLHGHIKVAPDGTIYVPNKGCSNEQAVIVSEDNGLTFEIRKVPGSTPGDTDPSVGIGTPDPTTGISPIYFGYANGDGRARIAVSRDRGKTWTDNQDVGKTFGIRSSVFPAVAAGDGDRAAYFFLGSTTPGGRDDDAAGNSDTKNAYNGVWYGYISTTFDGGKTWNTVNATPKDPVQRGVICTEGTLCPSGTRNLLDFNDATIDERGRILAAYADGCISEECIRGEDRNGDGKLNRFDNDGTDKAVIIRQSGGKTLRAQFDASGPQVPAAPVAAAVYNPDTKSVVVTWTPSDSDPPVTSYRIYRTREGVETLIAEVGANVFSYEDTSGKPTDRYRVAAVNPAGESSATCGTVAVTALQSSCVLPGKLVVEDKNDGDAAPNTPPTPETDIKSVYIAEPPQTDNVGRLVFTLNVGAPASTGTAPPNSQWYIIWNRRQPEADYDRFYVAMKSDAAGTVRFEYGKFGVALDATNPNPNANIPVKLGDADGGTYNPSSGVITISLAYSKAENLQVGNSLNGVNARTFFNQPDSGPKSQRNSSDITGEGSYKLVGSAVCTSTSPTPTPSATPTPSPSPGASPTPTPAPTPTNVQFSQSAYVITEACTSTNVTVTRTGTTNGTTVVNYSIDNGTAQQRGDFTFARGKLTFTSGETSKTFPVLICEDGYAEGTETATMRLNVTEGLGLGTQGSATLTINDNETTDRTTNPVDDAATFVCQHYHDFLNRQPDADGQAFWTNQIASCGTNAACIDEKRTNVSQAFFLSIEFQNTGYFVFRFYRASFSESAERPRGLPRYAEFLRDTQEIQRGVTVG
ncbi:MAG TPA: Calx-beta domain-containing protein, partial [Pyrinomonadaceae bacterium]